MRLAILIFCFAIQAPATASDFVVIANPSLSGVKISPGDVKQIFLGAKTRLDGKRVEPVVARSGSAHKEFASACLGKTESGLNNYFRMLVFSGKGSMPKSFATAAEIVDYVAKTEGAIGYVSREAGLNGVTVLDPK